MQQACVPQLEHMKTWHPDPDISGLGGGGGAVWKTFSALQASVGSKNREGGGGGPLEPPLFTNFQLWTQD